MNKVVLVTGASKGIGRAIAIELSKNNYTVIVNYNNSYDEAIKTFNEVIKFSKDSLMIKADVKNEIEVDLMFNEIEKKLGGVDIVINNAGVDLSDFFNKIDVKDIKLTLDTNFIGPFIVSRRASSHMKENKYGRIINISSTNGMNTYFPSSLAYDASKAALNQLTHELAMELKPYILVNAIAPGFIGTESELDGYTEEFLEEEKDKIFVKRIGKPEEVAYLVKFLISDEASYINNSIIRIDGGQYGS